MFQNLASLHWVAGGCPGFAGELTPKLLRVSDIRRSAAHGVGISPRQHQSFVEFLTHSLMANRCLRVFEMSTMAGWNFTSCTTLGAKTQCNTSLVARKTSSAGPRSYGLPAAVPSVVLKHDRLAPLVPIKPAQNPKYLHSETELHLHLHLLLYSTVNYPPL